MVSALRQVCTNALSSVFNLKREIGEKRNTGEFERTNVLFKTKQTDKTITINKIHLPSPTACLIPRVVLGKGTLKVTHFDVVRSVFKRKDYVNRHQFFVLSNILGKCNIYD